MIEVKGYPSRGYRDPNRSGEKKPTNPSVQAQHWYAHAFLKALRMQSAYPTAQVAIALPDFPRYRTLFRETASALQRLGVITMFVAESGQVDTIGLKPFSRRGRFSILNRPAHRAIDSVTR